MRLIRNRLIEGTPDQIRAAQAEQARRDAIQAARWHKDWIEYERGELEKHRAVWLDDERNVVLERAHLSQYGHTGGQTEADVVGWLLPDVNGWPLLLRKVSYGPGKASDYRAAISRSGRSADSPMKRHRAPALAAVPEPRIGGFKALLGIGGLGGKLDASPSPTSKDERHEAAVRARRVEVARRQESWEEIRPAERLVRRGPLLVDSESDRIFTRRGGFVFEKDRAEIAYVNRETALVFFVDASSSEVVFLERYTGAATWSDVVARQQRRLRAVK